MQLQLQSKASSSKNQTQYQSEHERWGFKMQNTETSGQFYEFYATLSFFFLAFEDVDWIMRNVECIFFRLSHSRGLKS